MAVIGGLAAAALAVGAAAYGTSERAGARFKQDPYSIEALKNLSATRSRLQDLGLGRNKDLQPFLDELLARHDRGYAADYGKKFSPFVGQYLDIARSPEDDELTRHMEQQYMRGVGDERRAMALGQARSLSDLLREVDLGGRERTLGGIEDITRFQQANIGSTVGIDEQLLRNPLTQAAYQDWRDRRTAPTAAEAGINSGISAFGATYGAMGGTGGGGARAGSPHRTPPPPPPPPTRPARGRPPAPPLDGSAARAGARPGTPPARESGPPAAPARERGGCPLRHARAAPPRVSDARHGAGPPPDRPP